MRSSFHNHNLTPRHFIKSMLTSDNGTHNSNRASVLPQFAFAYQVPASLEPMKCQAPAQVFDQVETSIEDSQGLLKEEKKTGDKNYRLSTTKFR